MSFLSKIFGNNDNEFDEVKIDKEVIDSVIYYAKEAYPNEFLALFDGKIKDKTLYITGLIFLPGETGSTGAVFHSDMVPPTLKYWGSVHSHPGPSAQPSDADLSTFSKHGVFHMIVCLPYSEQTFCAYDKYGDHMEYTIGDYSNLVVDEDIDDFFDDDDVLEDDEELEPGFFDEKDEFEKEFGPESDKQKDDSEMPVFKISNFEQPDKTIFINNNSKK